MLVKNESGCRLYQATSLNAAQQTQPGSTNLSVVLNQSCSESPATHHRVATHLRGLTNTAARRPPKAYPLARVLAEAIDKEVPVFLRCAKSLNVRSVVHFRAVAAGVEAPCQEGTLAQGATRRWVSVGQNVLVVVDCVLPCEAAGPALDCSSTRWCEGQDFMCMVRAGT